MNWPIGDGEDFQGTVLYSFLSYWSSFFLQEYWTEALEWCISLNEAIAERK